MNIKNPTNRNLKILHKKLWLWLAKNPSKKNFEWPGWKQFIKNPKFGCTVRRHCFVCQEAVNRGNTYGDHDPRLSCQYWPIKWTFPEDAPNHCNNPGYSEFSKWIDASTFLERSAWATKIANLYWSDKGAK